MSDYTRIARRLLDDFNRPEPFDPRDTAYAGDAAARGPGFFDGVKSSVSPSRYSTINALAGGGPDAAWHEALLTPAQNTWRNVLASEPVQSALTMANFLGPAPRMIPRPMFAAEGGGGGGTLKPRIQAEQAAQALREKFSYSAFDVAPGGSKMGESAYIRTPIGDMRFSDHAALSKPGRIHDFYGSDSSPGVVVERYQELLAAAQKRSAERMQAQETARDARLAETADIRASQAANRAAKEEFWRANGLTDATETARNKAWKAYKAGNTK